MLPVFRALSATTATVALIALAACSQTPTSNAPTSSPDATPAATPAATTPEHSHGNKPKININSAILSELDKLEAKLGVPALSNKIQGSRPYGSPQELVSKKVITQEQFEQIQDLVTIEDVVLTGEAKDIDYMTKLGLMKGHLLVAKELLDQGKPDQAEPHIGHPVEEIYADVEDQLKERNVKEFKTTLINLQDLVKAGAKDASKVKAEFNSAMQAVDAAIASLPEKQRQEPKFTLQVINGLLDTANSEYQASIANGKIAAIIEYQDSRGFVTYANSLYQNISGQIAKASPETDRAILTSMTELKKTWPSATAPATPVNTTDRVSQLIKTIEKDSQKLLKSV